MPTPRRDPDLALAAGIAAYIGAVLVVDGADALDGHEVVRQVLLGAATWGVLGVLLRREAPLVRAQTLLVVAFATAVEYTFSPLLEAYVYRIGTVPFFVPPGHGLVYLAALAIGRSVVTRAHARLLVAATVVAGTAWAVHGLAFAERRDVLGAFWFACLFGFLVWGRARLLYVGAFVVVSYLELVGTALGTWAWAPYDPVLGVVSQGNPPSGAAGGYGWFDLFAVLLAPWVLALSARLTGQLSARYPSDSAESTSSWSSPLVATASSPNGPSTPATEENLPPASSTMGTSAAMSQMARSGSQAMSTAPSATSMYDQKSP
jgi:FtsH-binding integral membrane protein